MHRLFIPADLQGKEIVIDDPRLLHYVRDVLRLGTGDEVALFNGRGSEGTGVIREVSQAVARLDVRDIRTEQGSLTGITVACAIPKKGLDDLIDDLTQLGVDAVIPMFSERVVVKLDAARRAARQERWTRVAGSAAQQSLRSTVPIIEPAADFNDVISRAAEFDLKLVPTLTGARQELAAVVAGARPRNVLVLIGPEGDFTPDEVSLAVGASFIPVSLGDLVLRVSVAAVAVVAYIRFALMDSAN